jgi:glycosyltransferase involved in cell wall biosynthesis
LKPERTALIDLRDRRWPNDWGRYPDATVFTLDNWHFDEMMMRAWLDGLDVVFMVETPYDWEMLAWAKQHGVRTVIQGNPEFYTDTQQPDAWWWPTPWLQDRVPRGPVVPVPVPDDWEVMAGGIDDRLEIVHVAGHRARADRNGTDVMSRVVRRLDLPVKVRVYGQDGSLVGFKAPKGVEVELFPDGVDDRKDMYRGAHVVVLPRRYGGLSLPAQEALASGCAVIMPDVSPNSFWPVIRVPANAHGTIHTKLGHVRLFTTDADAILRTLHDLHHDRDMLRYFRDEALRWADANRWGRHADHYRELLGCA